VCALLRVGACQTPEVLGDIDAALGWVEEFAGKAEAQDVDLLLFPECFLQGYLVEAPHVHRHALDLGAREFASVLRRLQRARPTLVFGLIEQRGGRYFNTAVVVRRGQLVGAYRKTHLVPGEALFDHGDAYPVFQHQGVRFGINICYDTRFPEAAAAVVAQDAQLLLVPSQNMMRHHAAEHWKELHHQIRAERVRETGMWLVSADVTGRRDAYRVGYGPTSVINPRGEIVSQVPLMTTGMVVADIR
jgi:5-aminopentanamidase